MSKFLGLDAGAWQAIGTLVLVVVTALYVRKTSDAVSAAEKSAAAAEEAAAHAKAASEATERMAEATELAELVESMPVLTADVRDSKRLTDGHPQYPVRVRSAGPGTSINVVVELFRGQLSGEREMIAGALAPDRSAEGWVSCPEEPRDNPMQVHIRYRDRKGREYLAVHRGHPGDTWGYGIRRRPHGSGEFLDWLIEPSNGQY